MKSPASVALSLGFSLNLSYVVNHACEQKRHPPKGGGVSDGNHGGKKNIVWRKGKRIGVRALWVLLNGEMPPRFLHQGFSS